MGDSEKKFTSSIKIITSGIGLLFTFYTIIDLAIFLSYSKPLGNERDYFSKHAWSLSLFNNMALLSLFVLPHSLLALPHVKAIFKKINLEDLQRSIYILVTCATLQIVMKQWNYINITAWEFDSQNNYIWWTTLILHVFSWIFIYIGSICMDINEMLGLKQVYYSIKSLPEPVNYKSLELQQLYTHMRHPSFLGFLIILWAFPVMTLDRLLLATLLTLYMYIGWNTDEVDYNYQKLQYRKKFLIEN